MVMHTLARMPIVALLIGLLGISTTTQAEERYAALVVDANTNRILFDRYADQRRHPASLTKMMTLYMVFEALERGRLSLQQQLPVSARAAGQPQTKLGVSRGQSITVEQAILGLVTRSANDAATVVAEALAETEWQFAQLMTARARDLGMRHTQFRNASGLHHAEQVTNALDMYILARALQLHYPQYYKYFSTPRFQFRRASFRNHNRLLSDYQGTDGIKTGYIRASGFNLVTSVRRGDQHLIGVVFGGRSARTRNEHMRKILDESFAKLQQQPIQLASMSRPVSSAAPPSAAAAAPPSLGAGASDSPGGWSIQVGAFRERDTAEQQLLQALRIIPDLRQGRALVETLQRADGRLYRARFQGFNEPWARTACGHLVQNRVDCMAVQLR